MMVRILATNGYYLGYDKKNVLHQTNKNHAAVWEEEKAKNVLKSLPSYLKGFCKYSLEPALDAEVDNTDADLDLLKKLTPEVELGASFTESRKITGCSIENQQVTDELDVLRKTFSKLKNIPTEIKKLQKELEELDLRRQDLLHITELESPKNLYKGYLIYKELREVSIKRREVKDLLMIATAYRDAFKLTDDADCVVKSVDDALTDRYYYIRVAGNTAFTES